jgi:hypothetical protein
MRTEHTCVCKTVLVGNRCPREACRHFDIPATLTMAEIRGTDTETTAGDGSQWNDLNGEFETLERADLVTTITDMWEVE